MTLAEALQYCAASELKIEFRHGYEPGQIVLLAHHKDDHHFMRQFELDAFMQHTEELLTFFLNQARQDLDNLIDA